MFNAPQADFVQVNPFANHNKSALGRYRRDQRELPGAAERRTQPQTMQDKVILIKEKPFQCLNNNRVLFELPLLSKWRAGLHPPPCQAH